MPNPLKMTGSDTMNSPCLPIIADMRRLPEVGPFPLHGIAATRGIEHALTTRLPAHELMSRAGLALARLTLALFPHARTIWVACGPGNNGGDALVAARHLALWRQELGAGPQPYISRTSRTSGTADSAWALSQATDLGLKVHDDPPVEWDAAIDGLLGIGGSGEPTGTLAAHCSVVFGSGRPVLCVDVPSGLNADTGQWQLPADVAAMAASSPRYTLTMLTAKPGLFTGQGRDAAGTVWVAPLAEHLPPPCDIWLGGTGTPEARRLHAVHKGSLGNVIVIGGQGIEKDGSGMTGAAVLAARAALHAGAGRVYLGLLGQTPQSPGWDPQQPELMLRHPDRLVNPEMLESAVTVCGCGGADAVKDWLPPVLQHAHRLVLDADALNTLATDPPLMDLLAQRAPRHQVTVLTPHPLEAARLLACSTADIQHDRVAAVQALANRTGAICVLKGSGSITAATGRTPVINASGNPALATAGTGDVLAGLIGSYMAQVDAHAANHFETVVRAVHHHAQAADWLVARTAGRRITAGELAATLSRVTALDVTQAA